MVPQLQHSTPNNEVPPLPLSLSLPLLSSVPTLTPPGLAPLLVHVQNKEPADASAAVPEHSLIPFTTRVVIKEEAEPEESMLPLSPFYRASRRAPKQIKPQKPKPTGKNFEDLRNREDILARWREKKARRTLNLNRPKVQYESRKRTALEKCRVNGKFVKPEIYKAYMEAQEQNTSLQSLHMVPTVSPRAAGTSE
jgi:CCT motif